MIVGKLWSVLFFGEKRALTPFSATDTIFRHCFRHTRPAWELIVVDNGSTDDTAADLAGVRDTARVPVTIVSNPQNGGFPRAINQGLQAARGEYLVLLNNDAVVTDGWLDQLRRPAGGNSPGNTGNAETESSKPEAPVREFRRGSTIPSRALRARRATTLVVAR